MPIHLSIHYIGMDSDPAFPNKVWVWILISGYDIFSEKDVKSSELGITFFWFIQLIV
jgi:hypothetical protein